MIACPSCGESMSHPAPTQCNEKNRHTPAPKPETPVEKYIGAAIGQIGQGLTHLNVAVFSDWSSARAAAVHLCRDELAKADDLLRSAERALERATCPECGEPTRNGVPIHRVTCSHVTPGIRAAAEAEGVERVPLDE